MPRAATARAAALSKGGDDARYPCGKLKPSHSPAVIKRVVQSALIRGENPLLGTPLGWLHMHGHLSNNQLCAGAEYARFRVLYDRVMGFPRRSAKTLGRSDDGTLTDDECVLIRRQFENLYAKLTRLGATKHAGSKVVSILDDTCVDLQAPSFADQILLRAGLDVIADHFHIGAPPATLSQALCPGKN